MRRNVVKPTVLGNVVAVMCLLTCVVNAQPQPSPTRAFETLMQTVADGWNENNARKAANCFAENAIYTEPPDKQRYVGRERLFRFFGGDAGRQSAMRMRWHRLAFNEATQTGFGEFTFSYEGGHAHGIVTVKLTNGLISHWREYFYESALDWPAFVGDTTF